MSSTSMIDVLTYLIRTVRRSVVPAQAVRSATHKMDNTSATTGLMR